MTSCHWQHWENSLSKLTSRLWTDSKIRNYEWQGPMIGLISIWSISYAHNLCLKILEMTKYKCSKWLFWVQNWSWRARLTLSLKAWGQARSSTERQRISKIFSKWRNIRILIYNCLLSANLIKLYSTFYMVLWISRIRCIRHYFKPSFLAINSWCLCVNGLKPHLLHWNVVISSEWDFEGVFSTSWRRPWRIS